MSSSDSTAYAKNLPIRSNVTSGMDRILNMPRCKVYHSGSQSLNTATVTTLSFDGDTFDSDGMHDTTTLNSRITIHTQGVYLVSANIFFAASAAGTYRIIQIFLNGVTDIAGVTLPPVASGGDGTRLSASTPYALYAEDYLEVKAAQDTGGGLNVLTPPSFSACLISTF